MKNICIISILLFCLMMPSQAHARTARLVHDAGFTDYTTIQSALQDAVNGDEVHASAGTYSEHVTMKTGVNLLGGYTEVDWSRDAGTNVTTIDGGGSGNTVTAATATLDGFTVKGGGSTGIVAGVYVFGCSPTITNNNIVQNGKHGIYIEGDSSPVIEKNVIASNGYYGVYCYSFGNGGTPLIYNNTIDGNRRGIQIYYFSPVIKNNIITSNSEYGLALGVSSSPVIDYNDVWSNTQGNYLVLVPGAHDKSVDPLYVGGGDYHLQASPALSPCIDAGVDVGLPYNNVPDMGAYESATIRLAPWPPDGLRATPGSGKVRLDWQANSAPDLSGYKVSYGNVSGSYTDTIDVHNVITYDVRSLVNDASYFFAVRAYDTGSNISEYSSEVSATPTAGEHELPHYNYDASYRGGDCTVCHYKADGNNLLPSGYDYRYSTELCLSCHNLTGQGRGKVVSAVSSHPVFVNASSGGGWMPTYGNITGRYSNQMGSHLKDGKLVVCNTCHNVMEKGEDPGRTWELTTFTYEDSWRTYALQRGGWSWYDYLVPDVYTSQTLISAPTYTKDRNPMKLAATALSDYNIDAGKITFASPFYDYAYVSLYYPYLRVSNSDNTMCLDCHNTGTHKSANCLTCHESHNYVNRHGIRPRVKTPSSGIRNVVFGNVTGQSSFADGDNIYDGICEVCHTSTKYYRNNGTGFVNHSGGFNYNGKNCVTCHTHDSGFAKY